MRIDSATIVIEPRSVGACLDLASLFYREHVKGVLALTLGFGLPACLLAFAIAFATDYGLLWSIVIFLTFSPFLGAALVAAAGPRVFGEPFSLAAALRAVWSQFGQLVYAIVITRALLGLSVFLCVFPAIYPAVYYGFSSEVLLLEQLGGRRSRERLSELVRHISFDLLVRLLVLIGFTLVVVVSLFLLVDQLLDTLLGLPLVYGRATNKYWGQEVLNLFSYDPWVIAVLWGIVWLVYPLVRLGWFFCYLDVRIRKEGWDVELDFRVEARRLELVP